MIKACLRIEMRKALVNKAAMISCTGAIFLAVRHAVNAIILYENLYDNLQAGKIEGNPMLTSMSLFCRWLGADVTSFESNLFYYLLPIIAALPYGWSLVEEIQSGYSKNILCRTSRKVYFISKYIAVFSSAALIVGIGLILNFAVLFLFLPSLKMDSIYPYGIVGERSMWSEMYYESPFLYTVLYIFLDMLFAGLIASICTAAAFFLGHKTTALLVPFFLMLGIDYLDNSLRSGWELSPLKFLHVLPVANDRTALGIITLGGILLVSTLIIVWCKGVKSEAL